MSGASGTAPTPPASCPRSPVRTRSRFSTRRASPTWSRRAAPPSKTSPPSPSARRSGTPGRSGRRRSHLDDLGNARLAAFLPWYLTRSFRAAPAAPGPTRGKARPDASRRFLDNKGGSGALLLPCRTAPDASRPADAFRGAGRIYSSELAPASTPTGWLTIKGTSCTTPMGANSLARSTPPRPGHPAPWPASAAPGPGVVAPTPSAPPAA